MILEAGKVYEVMRQRTQYQWELGKARADVVDGQEVLVSAYRWADSTPEIFEPIHRVGLTGRIFTDEELKGTGFGILFPPEPPLK